MMLRKLVLLLVLPVLLAACDSNAPAPVAPSKPTKLPALPAGCVWVPMQGNGVDDAGNKWTFTWNQPICGQPGTAPTGAYDPTATQAEQAFNTWLILRASSRSAVGHYGGGGEEEGGAHDGEGGGDGGK